MTVEQLLTIMEDEKYRDLTCGEFAKVYKEVFEKEAKDEANK